MIAYQVVHQHKIGRIEHLISRRQTSLCNDAVVQLTNSLQTIDKTRSFRSIWLVNQALIAIPIGPRLSSIDAHDDKNLVCDLLLQL